MAKKEGLLVGGEALGGASLKEAMEANVKKLHELNDIEKSRKNPKQNAQAPGEKKVGGTRTMNAQELSKMLKDNGVDKGNIKQKNHKERSNSLSFNKPGKKAEKVNEGQLLCVKEATALFGVRQDRFNYQYVCK